MIVKKVKQYFVHIVTS